MSHAAPPEIIPKPSAFDGHNPPEKDLLSDCVHCGFCLPACPTYVLWGEEMDSPRGRIYMMAKASEGQSQLDQNFRLHMDNCLGCMACMTACPSGVQYDKLIEDTRPQVERHIARPADDSLFRRLLFATFPHPGRLRLLAMPMFLYQRTGLQKIVRASGLLHLLPKRLAAMEALLPTVPSSLFRSLPERTEPQAGLRNSSQSIEEHAPHIIEDKPRWHMEGRPMRVGMLAGCVQQVFFQHVNEATYRVLAAEGHEVVIPASQGCCGALQYHSGVEPEARAFAKRMIQTFEEADVDFVVINAAGCGSTMKSYGHMLRDDAEWSVRATAFSEKCKDISEVLLAHPPVQPRKPLPLRVAYQDACHLRHAQGIFAGPRDLLHAIPELDVAEIAEANLCCGSAGVYNLLHPETGQELGDRKVENLLAVNAQAIISANPGCLLQLQAGLRRRGATELPTFHMVELVDASIRGISAQELLQRRN